MLGDDQPESRPCDMRGSHEDVETRRALPLPLVEQSTNLGAAVDARPAWKALRSGAGVYFPAILIAIRARPCFRRRFSVLRPPFVFIRARNPCLFARLRLRGL